MTCDITIQEVIVNSLSLTEAFVIGLIVASVIWFISAVVVVDEVFPDE